MLASFSTNQITQKICNKIIILASLFEIVYANDSSLQKVQIQSYGGAASVDFTSFNEVLLSEEAYVADILSKQHFNQSSHFNYHCIISCKKIAYFFVSLYLSLCVCVCVCVCVRQRKRKQKKQKQWLHFQICSQTFVYIQTTQIEPKK